MAKKKVIVKEDEEEIDEEEDSDTTSQDLDDLSIDDVVEGLDAFEEEEEPSELERDMLVSEGQFEEEIQEERVYTVPLAKKFRKAPNWRRTKKAVKVLREFVEQHMKPEWIYIAPEVNERLWENGIKNPPRKLRIKCTKSVEGLVRVYLA